MGKYISAVVQERMGKNLLELGGNNALIIDETADLKLAIPAVVWRSRYLPDKDVRAQEEFYTCF
ncbi:MAG: aldehyde dehydrogenase family protein [Chitinophagales bacterium]